MRNRVVIIGITGFSGGGGNEGIPNMIDRFRRVIGQPLGVPDRNFIHKKWNSSDNANPTSAPDIEELKRAIDSVTPSPSYLAIIGHSFGAWAATRLSRDLGQEPDFVGLIDLVYNVGASHVSPRGGHVHNWYQDIVWPYGESLAGVNGVTRHHITMQETWDREPICAIPWIRGCLRRKRTSHTDIDSNERVWRDIYDIIKPQIEGI